MPSMRARLVAASLGAGLLLAVPSSALAAAGDPDRPNRHQSGERPERAPRDLEQLRAKCLQAVDKRLKALESAGDKLAGAKHVTDEHRAALGSILVGSSESLGPLAEQIKTDDLESLKADCKSIFEDHRVFALVLPRTRLVVGADAADAAAGKLTEVAGRIEAAIAKAESNGQDVTRALADLEAMHAEIESGTRSAGGVAGQVMGLTPADWNADHEVLTPARKDLRSARRDLKEARELGRGIVAGLRGDLNG